MDIGDQRAGRQAREKWAHDLPRATSERKQAAVAVRDALRERIEHHTRPTAARKHERAREAGRSTAKNRNREAGTHVPQPRIRVSMSAAAVGAPAVSTAHPSA